MPTSEDSPTTDVFRWSDVPDNHKVWLRNQTQTVIDLAHKSAQATIQLGWILQEVRDCIPGKFERWVRTETPYSIAHVYRVMATARIFGETSQIERFDKSALYILAQESTPSEAREEACLLAETGVQITRALALELIADCEDVSPRQLQKYETARAQIDRIRIDGRRHDQNAHTERLETLDTNQLAEVGKQLLTLADSVTLLSFSRLEDAEDEEPHCSITIIADGQTRTVAADDWIVAIAMAAGVEQRKFCPGCCEAGETLTISMFGRDRTQAGGRMRYCSVCERKRKNDRQQERKRKRQVDEQPVRTVRPCAPIRAG